MEIRPLPALAGSGQQAMNKLIYPLVTALALTGCVNGTKPRLSESHPANPTAAPGSYSRFAPFLMADTNLVAITTVSTNAPESGHEHGTKTKPEPKAPPKHDHD